MTMFDIDEFKTNLKKLEGLTPDQQKFGLNKLYSETPREKDAFQDLLNYVIKLNEPEAIRQRLAIQSEFDKERMAEAGKYKMLFGIPDTISQAFGNQAAMNVLGARSVTDAYNAALQAYPNTQFATTAYNPRSYFS